MLISPQKQVLDQFLAVLRSSGASLPVCLIYGPRGSGKRMTVRAAANAVGLRFIEVNVSDNPQYVRERLFGDVKQAECVEENGPGECGSTEGSALYLSGMESLDPSLHQVLHRVVSDRRYIDATGRQQIIPGSTWIIGGLRHDPEHPDEDVYVNLEHWLCSAFSHQVGLDICRDKDAFWTIVCKLAASLGRQLQGEPDHELWSIARRTKDRLHSVKRWVTNASFRVGDNEALPVELLRAETLNDLKSLLARVQYRGQVLDERNVEKWSAQFCARKSIAFHLIREIATRYYISSQEYHRGISEIISRFSIPKGASVTFCTWQAQGRSAPRIAHEMKNQANWKVADGRDIDLRCHPIVRRGLDPDDEHFLLIVDDFSGSGRALLKLFDGNDAPACALLRELPNARLLIGLVAGYREALQKIMGRAAAFGDRVRVVPFKVFDESDRCFTANSRIFPDRSERDDFRAFCVSIAREYFPRIRGKHRLGYNGIGSLVVFSNTVPNNSLPLLWFDSSDWFPMFPASGLPDDMLGEDNVADEGL